MDIPQWAFYLVALLGGLIMAAMLYFVVHDKDNPIEWWHFISSKGQDGQQYADMTKLGQATGIFLCVSTTFIFSARKDVTPEGFSILLGVVLLYLGGVQAYQTYMKSRAKPKENENA